MTFAAERYGVSVVAVTVSKEQAELARERNRGLPVEIRFCDYRDLNERFDAVTSIAMIEAVGHRYYGRYMQVVERCLAPEGRFVLHGFYGNQPVGPEQARWLDRYIFPGGAAPSLAQVLRAAEGRFTVEALQRLDGYDRTLAAWEERFRSAWPRLCKSYDERFFRMWSFYLGISRGIFRSRLCHVWQIVFSREIPGIAVRPSTFPLAEIEAR